MPLLFQLPGFASLTPITILAAVGDITRFPAAKKLVGYAGLGMRVHDSGMTHSSVRITQAGRRDLRRALVNAAGRSSPVEKRVCSTGSAPGGRSKAFIAIARKLLVVVWYVLHDQAVDRFADPGKVACSFFRYAYQVGVNHLSAGQSALAFMRKQLDCLGIGRDLQEVPWGSSHPKLPPSQTNAAPKSVSGVPNWSALLRSG